MSQSQRIAMIAFARMGQDLARQKIVTESTEAQTRPQAGLQDTGRIGADPGNQANPADTIQIG